MNTSDLPFVLSIAGESGSGKTTLLEALIPELRRAGLRVAAVKHTLHSFEMDQPGKDSYRLREAGAEIVLLYGPKRLALVREWEAERSLEELIQEFLREVDLVIAEGHSRVRFPRIAVLSDVSDAAESEDFADPLLLAVVSEATLPTEKPVFRHDQVADLAAFILRCLHENRTAP